MKLPKQLFIGVLIILISCKNSHAQFKARYGFSIDARWEIVFKYHYLSNFRISGAVAVAAESKHAMPFLQYTLATFRGGMGSSFSMDKRENIHWESRVAFGCVFGNKHTGTYLNQKGIDSLHFIKKVYTMGFLNPTPLTNPFNSWYVLLNSNFILRKERNKEGIKDFGQYVGNTSFGARNWDIDYFNDGTPFHWVGLGDGKDRYWTGGGFLSVNVKNSYDHPGKKQKAIRRVIFGFDRYTGFFPYAFEVANLLGLVKVPYDDPQESFYNKGRLYVGAELASVPGLIPMLSLKDNDVLDIQNFIHRKITNAALHTTFHKQSLGFNLYYNHTGEIK